MGSVDGCRPETVKEERSARGKWAYVYLAEILSVFGYAKVGVGVLRVERLSLIV